MRGRPPRVYETPASLLILDHYRENKLIWGWDNERVVELCRKLNLTPHELGRLVGLFHAPDRDNPVPTHHLTQRYMEANHWPPWAAIQFAKLSQWFDEAVARRDCRVIKPSPPVFPVSILSNALKV